MIFLLSLLQAPLHAGENSASVFPVHHFEIIQIEDVLLSLGDLLNSDLTSISSSIPYVLDPGEIEADQTICSNDDPAAFTSKTDASGYSDITYSWQISTNGITFNDITGATGSTYDAGPLTANMWYRRRAITVLGSDTKYTNAVKITVNQKSANPSSATASLTTIFIGQTTLLSLNGGGGGTGEIIQWYSGSCGGTLVGTGNNLTVNPIITTTYYGRYKDGFPCNYNSTCASVAIIVKDYLTISKILTSAPVKPGDLVTYQLTYYNNNTTGNATGIRVVDYLPSADLFTFISASNGGTFDGTNRTITWTGLPNLTHGDHFDLTVTGRVGRTGWSGYDAASYYISAGSSGPTIVSNNATVETSITNPVSLTTPTDFNISQFCGASLSPNVLNGYIKSATPSDLYYVITLTNAGNITDKFVLTSNVTGIGTMLLNGQYLQPDGITPISSTPWIPAGQPYSFIFRIWYPGGGINPGDINNLVLTFTSTVCGTTTTMGITTTAYGGQPPVSNIDMAVSKSVTPDPVSAGNNLVYTITATNNYPTAATNVNISDYLGSSVTYIGHTFTPASGLTVNYDATNKRLLAIKTSQRSSDAPIQIILTVRASCSSVPSVSNTVTVSNTNGDSNSANDSYTVVTNVTSNTLAPIIPGASICSGTPATLTASGASLGYGYKWYSAQTGGNLLLTGNPYTTPNLTTTANYYVSIYDVSGVACESARTMVTVTVLADPVITAQPQSKNVCEGLPESFSVSVSGSSITYQWEYSSDNGITWAVLTNVTPYSGTITPVLSISAVTNAMSGYRFRVKVRSGTCNFITSNPASLIVNPLPTTSAIYHQ